MTGLLGVQTASTDQGAFVAKKNIPDCIVNILEMLATHLLAAPTYMPSLAESSEEGKRIDFRLDPCNRPNQDSGFWRGLQRSLFPTDYGPWLYS